MSSPIAIIRSGSPSASSSTSFGSDASTSFSSSSSSSQALTYSRDELLSLATSPLSQVRAPASLLSFPEIMRKTRRGVMEAYQALDYARSMTPEYSVRSASRSPSLKSSHSGSPTHNAADLTPAHAVNTQLSTPAPVWHADVYVPPARRAIPAREPEQRARPGRDSRALNSRGWRRPSAARAIQVQARW